MKIAIIGGGISGLTAAYELEQARKRGADIDWHLYEASNRLGGIIQTTRIPTPEGEYILEGGPDGWVTEKPWARELAIELGLEDQLIYSNDATRKTWICGSGGLQQTIPDGMRLMVPENLDVLNDSSFFSEQTKADYASEPLRHQELKDSAPHHDESVENFVLRHFGNEVLRKLARPLLTGVFGGDVGKLSVRAVMPQFVELERKYGSLILGLQERAKERGGAPPKPIFTSMRNGMDALVDALTGSLPADRMSLRTAVIRIDRKVHWSVQLRSYDAPEEEFRSDGLTHVIMALPLDVARRQLDWIAPGSSLLNLSAGTLSHLLPRRSSSSILASLAWTPELASTFSIPQGFGFLMSGGFGRLGQDFGPILACTFVDQKFPHRAPPGARILRVFFSGDAFKAQWRDSDSGVTGAAFRHLREILRDLPHRPVYSSVRRLPHSLPQYEVGHLDRMAKLNDLLVDFPGLHLLGNAYRGVGLPDLIRDARSVARKLTTDN